MNINKSVYRHLLSIIIIFIGMFFITPTITPQVVGQPPEIGGCQLFPTDNIWNTPITNLPVSPNSDDYINSIGASTTLHPDFGSGEWPPDSGAPIGIPYIIVPANQTLVDVSFNYADESDPSPYPIPPDAPIEGGSNSDSDRHVLVVQEDTCHLYELFSAYPNADNSWDAGSGAIFDLNSNALRPDGWTSADAAGLPILPGLIRYEEVAAGEINHAIRFTAAQTQKAYVWPARHYASDLTDPQYPPLGQRFRLKADFDISGFSSDVQVILTAMKTYGLILADNGSDWFISGVPSEQWDNDVLRELKQISGSNFEAVDVSELMVDSDSGQVQQTTPDFSLTVEPEQQAIKPGQSANYTVQVDGTFSGIISISSNSSPLGLIVNAPSTLTVPAQATLTVTDTHTGSSLLPGIIYQITLTGTGNLTSTGTLINHTATVEVLVGGTWVYLPFILK